MHWPPFIPSGWGRSCCAHQPPSLNPSVGLKCSQFAQRLRLFCGDWSLFYCVSEESAVAPHDGRKDRTAPQLFFLLWTAAHVHSTTSLSRLSTARGGPPARRSALLVSNWSEEDVSAWLREDEALAVLVDKFRANNIDGTELLQLTKETLASELCIGEKSTCC